MLPGLARPERNGLFLEVVIFVHAEAKGCDFLGGVNIAWIMNCEGV